jgi:microcystin-dependent protein
MFSSNDLPAGGASRRGWLKKLGGLVAGGALLGKSQPAAARSTQSVASVDGLDSFLSEIMLVAFNFAPKGWALCNGQLLPIAQNQPLFSLIGTSYGGDGRNNFALPDLRGRVIVGSGSGFIAGQSGGEERHVLLASELPPHAHGMKTSTAIGTTNLSGIAPTTTHYLADNGGGSPQYNDAPNTVLANSTTPALVNISSATGGGQAHENRQPYLTLNYVICLQGIFPSPN